MQDVVVTSPVAAVLLFNMVNEYGYIGKSSHGRAKGRFARNSFKC
jgi:hypothetical protein